MTMDKKIVNGVLIVSKSQEVPYLHAPGHLRKTLINHSLVVVVMVLQLQDLEVLHIMLDLETGNSVLSVAKLILSQMSVALPTTLIILIQYWITPLHLCILFLVSIVTMIMEPRK